MTRKHFFWAGAAAVLLGVGMLIGRSGSTVSADEAQPGEQQSFLSKLGLKRDTVIVPEGTTISVRLAQGISTEKNNAGDPFSARLDAPLVVNGKTLVPRGSEVSGMLTSVVDAGRVEGRASLTMVLRRLVVDGDDYDVTTQPLTLVARSTKKKDAAIVGGSAAAGALIGAIAGGGKGAAIGAGVGGGSGAGYVLATKGDPVAYGPEARFTFRLSEPLDLPVYAP